MGDSPIELLLATESGIGALVVVEEPSPTGSAILRFKDGAASMAPAATAAEEATTVAAAVEAAETDGLKGADGWLVPAVFGEKPAGGGGACPSAALLTLLSASSPPEPRCVLVITTPPRTRFTGNIDSAPNTYGQEHGVGRERQTRTVVKEGCFVCLIFGAPSWLVWVTEKDAVEQAI